MIRTGIKTFIRKIVHDVKYPYYIHSKKDTFPENPESPVEVNSFIDTVENQVKDWGLDNKLGLLYSKPHSVTLSVWKRLLPLNTNNLGVWSHRKAEDISGTMRAERSLILKMINLYGGKSSDWTGYVTSGATEANIFSLWMGRNYLSYKYHIKKMCLITNDLTHYSIKKAGDVTRLENFTISLNNKNWNTSAVSLEKLIRSLYIKGYRGFLLPITLGYTQTGTNDDFLNILKTINKVQREIPIKCFVWIDAAINGLVLPFLKADFLPLGNTSLGGIGFDFHKTGMSPIPSGIIIYRSNLKKYVERRVAYIGEADSTLLGSRPGVSPTSMLALVNRLGKSGFTKLLKNAQKRKKLFITQIKKSYPKVIIVNEEPGISFGLVTKTPLPKKFTDKYGLYAKKWNYEFESGNQKLFIYKFNFLPKP